MRARVGVSLRSPSRRRVPGRRILQEQGSDHAHHKEEHAQYLKRRPPPQALNQRVRHGAEDRRSRSVAADHQPHHQPPFVRKPLGRNRHGDRVAEAVADSNDDAESDIEKQERAGHAREDEPGASQRPADGSADARPSRVLNPTGQHEAGREHHDGDGEDPGGLGARPAELLLERQNEHAPGVEGTQRQVHRDTADNRKPSIHHTSLLARNMWERIIPAAALHGHR